jgi:hypothetical protein
MVDRASLRFADFIVNVQVVFRIIEGGCSLTGKTANLHFVILGSSPNISNLIYLNWLLLKNRFFSPRSSIGWAEHWRCLGYKFKSYLEHIGVLKFGNQVPLRTEWCKLYKFKSCHLYMLSTNWQVINFWYLLLSVRIAPT